MSDNSYKWTSLLPIYNITKTLNSEVNICYFVFPSNQVSLHFLSSIPTHFRLRLTLPSLSCLTLQCHTFANAALHWSPSEQHPGCSVMDYFNVRIYYSCEGCWRDHEDLRGMNRCQATGVAPSSGLSEILCYIVQYM